MQYLPIVFIDGSTVFTSTTVRKTDMIVLRLIMARLKDPSTYMLAVIVGTIINLYGQILVPILRGNAHPLVTITREFETNGNVFITSVAIAYIFPIFVGVFSSVRAQYKLRHAVIKAEFPDKKPDPVFRTLPDSEGRIIVAGAVTEEFLGKHGFRNASDILGEGVWNSILDASRKGLSSKTAAKVFVKDCNEEFLVSHSPANDGAVNVYLTRLAAA